MDAKFILSPVTGLHHCSYLHCLYTCPWSNYWYWPLLPYTYNSAYQYPRLQQLHVHLQLAQTLLLALVHTTSFSALASSTTYSTLTGSCKWMCASHWIWLLWMPVLVPSHWNWSHCWRPQQSLQPLRALHSAWQKEVIVIYVEPCSLN